MPNETQSQPKPKPPMRIPDDDVVEDEDLPDDDWLVPIMVFGGTILAALTVAIVGSLFR